MSIIALIPARAGSKGIKGKNFRELGGRPLWTHAVICAKGVGAQRVVVSSDANPATIAGAYGLEDGVYCDLPGAEWLMRPAHLAQDDTPMIAVVEHALSELPGQPDDVIVLLQPTQPFRTPGHVKTAIALLRETQADSVVSVVPLPLTHSPEMVCRVSTWEDHAKLSPWVEIQTWDWMPQRRQDVIAPACKRDGTVYAFWRRTVTRHGTIYGQDVRPLIIAPEDTCELDTESDWREVERRWAERHGPSARS